jgi:hypothetical protein
MAAMGGDDSRVSRWAEGPGATQLRRQTTDFVAGEVPTRDDG